MLRLLSLSDDPWSVDKFDANPDAIRYFLDDNGLDGLELMRWHDPQFHAIPGEKIIGRHLPYWPIWLDFWRSDREELLRQFGDMDTAVRYYAARTPGEFADNYRRLLMDCDAMGVRYAVFHVSHVRLTDCYTGQFEYSDGEIINAFADMLNEVLAGYTPRCELLFENHWYPGLTFLDAQQTRALLDRVKAPRKGLVLDTGHLMNTNPELNDMSRAVDYILDVLDGMGPLRSAIRAIHLNGSLTGGYQKASRYTVRDNPADSFDSRLMAVMAHVSRIDNHLPFCHRDLRKVIDTVDPVYLVYELTSKSLDELRHRVQQQSSILV